MRRHRIDRRPSRRAAAIRPSSRSSPSWRSPWAPPGPRRGRPAVPGIPSTTRPSTTRRACSAAPRCTRSRRRSTRSSSGPAPRSSSTRRRRRAPRTPPTAEHNAQPLMDQWGVGRKGFDDGLVILFDLNAHDPATARSSCTPAPGTGPSSCRTRTASRSTRTTCCRCSSGATSTGRCWWRWRRSMPPRRPSTPRASPSSGSSTRCSACSSRRSLFVLIVGARAARLVSARARPRLPRRPVDPHPGAARSASPRPPARSSATASRPRRALTTASLDLASRGLIEFDAEQTGLIAKSTQLSIRTIAGDDRGPGRDVAPRAGPRRGRWTTARSSCSAGCATSAAAAQLIDPKELLKLGQGRVRVRHADREARRPAGLVHRAAGEGQRPLDGARDHRRDLRRDRACSSGSTCHRTGSSSSAARSSRPGS